MGRRTTGAGSASEAAERVQRWQAWYAADAGRSGAWAIEVRSTGQVAGTLLLKALPGADNEPTSDIEVGWHLHPDSWGHGYATEAARGAVDHAFGDGLTEIYAVVKPGNEPSIAVTRRLGMTPLGRTTRWYGGIELEGFTLPRPPS
jgi:RimJ/RimL family protein N-acetyltransferase